MVVVQSSASSPLLVQQNKAYWINSFTSHDVSVQNLCIAHGVKHMHVQTKTELQNAMYVSQHEEIDCVIEVKSGIEANATFHNHLRNFARQGADEALSIISNLSVSKGFKFYKVIKMEYSSYRIQLCAPPTSASSSGGSTIFYREGFIVTLFLEDGNTGFGEVAPLEIHRENMIDVKEQLQYLIHVMEGVKLNYTLPLLKGAISYWIWNTLGIPPDSMYPSVRCGLEMAMLSAIASSNGSSLLNILHPSNSFKERSLDVQICGLVDSQGSSKDMANIANSLVKEGFTTLKIKVARCSDPVEDGAVIQEIRKKVGNHIKLRADANRNWTYIEAIQFANSVKNCGLQYIEEPVKNEDDIIKFCEETGLPVALDETISFIGKNPLKFLNKFNHSGIVAVVIKPNVVGGFENAALIARWAHQNSKMAVISSAFESGLSLSAYIQFSSYLDLQNDNIRRITKNSELSSNIAHGLGTYKWLKEDVTTESLNIKRNPNNGVLEASVFNASRLFQQFQINHSSIVQTFSGKKVEKYQLLVKSDGLAYSVNVLETGQSINDCVVVFLHGFLGTSEDWVPIMKGVSQSYRCIAIDLPGHGQSNLQSYGDTQGSNLSMEVISNLLCKVFDNLDVRRVTLVGYSMGARIALHMAVKRSDKVKGAIIISGSPGLIDQDAKEVRKVKDDFRAEYLLSNGLELFLDSWYAEPMWKSLRSHPNFKKIVLSRSKHQDLHSLARILSDLSIGRQKPLWEDLKCCKLPIQFIIGEKDVKFKKLAQAMYHKISEGSKSIDGPEIVEVSNCGHAVHLENPLLVINAISKYLKRVQRN